MRRSVRLLALAPLLLAGGWLSAGWAAEVHDDPDADVSPGAAADAEDPDGEDAGPDAAGSEGDAGPEGAPRGVEDVAPAPAPAAAPAPPPAAVPPPFPAVPEASLAALRTRINALRALTAGTLPPEVDRARLFGVDALDPAWRDVPEPVVTAILRALRGQPPAAPRPSPPAGEALAGGDALVDALHELAGVAAAFLALPDERRAELLAPPPVPVQVEDELARLSAAEEVARQAEAAAAEAQAQAEGERSEARRRLAEERQRLLKVKADLAQRGAELARRALQAASTREQARAWADRVEELARRSPLDGGKERDADTLYETVREELGAARAALAAALDAATHPPTPLDLGTTTDAAAWSDPELARLRDEVAAQAAAVREREAEVRWAEADALRDAVVAMNHARLDLLSLASPGLRSRVLGFGPEGVRQVQRELHQIWLELTYRFGALPRHGRKVWHEFRTAPVPFVGSLLELLAAVLLFVWWRRRADRVLVRARSHAVARDPPTVWSRRTAAALWYAQRIRKPLEWLVLLAVLVGTLVDVLRLEELGLLWTTAAWLLSGYAAVLLIDAAASRSRSRRGAPSGSAELRFRSLRVVGLTVVTVGLLLSLVRDLVGAGAIFAWTLRLAWVLVIPIALLLVRWWKPVIHGLLEELPADHRLAQFVLLNRTGWISYPAAAAGGVWLLVEGLARWGTELASGSESARRALAWLFRREVRRLSRGTGDRAGLGPLPPEAAARLQPEAPTSVDLEHVISAPLEAVARVIVSPRRTLSAVVAPRGGGKSTFLVRVVERCDDLRVVLLDCPPSGYAGLVDGLGQALGLGPGAREDAVGRALSEAAPLVVLVDDAHRIVRPAIGGLRELDALGALARSTTGDVSWVLAFQTASWQFVERARGDRVFFDQIVRLPPWSEEALGELMRARTAEAGLTPSFEGLHMPRQLDEEAGDESARTEQRYMRLLWDHADGNPAVALHFWRESLGCDADGQPMVRLFHDPPVSEIGELPLTLHFVLRAVRQLELAREPDVVACTALPAADVADALRFALSRGYVEEMGAHVRVTWPWYRAITVFLRRQHLLNG